MKKAIFQKVFFGIMLAFMGTMSWKTFRILQNATDSLQYAETDCLILKNSWIRKGDGHRLDLEYSYTFQNQSFTGTRYQWGLDIFESQNRSGAAAFVKTAPPPTNVKCYIDSNKPDISVIRVGHPFHWYELWVIFGFGLIGLFGFFISVFYPAWAEKTFVPADPS